ncbi:MAG: hypothetical protein R2875_01370 [Desulfobacterales bacterium]
MSGTMSAAHLDVAGIDQLGPSGNRVNVQIEAARDIPFSKACNSGNTLYAVG